jgi:hypothetical protein
LKTEGIVKLSKNATILKTKERQLFQFALSLIKLKYFCLLILKFQKRWITYISVAPNANGSLMGSLIGNALVDAYGTLSVREHDVLIVVKYGRKLNALGMQEDVIR